MAADMLVPVVFLMVVEVTGDNKTDITGDNKTDNCTQKSTYMTV